MWNDLVQDKDTVYHVGDFAFNNPCIYLPKLRGKIKLIPGNHDRQIKKAIGCKSLSGAKTEVLKLIQKVKVEDQLIYLCHYPIESWPQKHYNSWHLFGHVHSSFSSLREIKNRIHIGIDSSVDTLYSFEDIKEQLSEDKTVLSSS